MGWSQGFGTSVKIRCQFWIFDQVVLGQGRHTGLGAAAAHCFLAQCCHLEKGEQTENYV